MADSKLCTRTNLGYITAAEGKFVTVLPGSRREDRRFREHLRKEGVRWRFLVDIPSQRRKDDPPDRFSACAGPFNTTEEGYRLIWLRSSHKSLLDRRARDASIQAAPAELDTLARKLNSRNYKTRAAIKKAVAGALIERCVRINMARNHITSLPLLPEERVTQTPTCPRILEAFSPLTWYDFQQGDNYVAFPMKLTGLHKTLLNLLGVPEKIYS
ncbi:MAG: hypothetical protein AB1742_07630 [bacterium]